MCGNSASLSEVTVIDRQKYIKELSRLLSGMAPADREAVLRGVNARFDESGDDDAVIKALGSPTFAAVQVLRGYVAPDPEEHPEAYEVEPEPQPAAEETEEPAAEETALSAEEAAETAGNETAGPETAEVQAGGSEAAQDEASAKAVEEAPADGAAEEPAAGPEAPAAEEAVPVPEEQGQAEAESAPEDAEAESEEPAGTAEEPPAEPEPGADAEAQPAAEAESAPEPAESVPAAELPDDFPDIDAIIAEAEAAAAADIRSGPAQDAAEPEAPQDGGWDEEDETPEGLGEPVSGPPKPRAKVAALIFYSIAAVIIGVPVTALIALAALAVLAVGAAVLGAGVLAISFCFLGLTVVADILMCAGAGLVLLGVGLPLMFFAVWLFVRGAVGFVNLVIRKGGDWCYDHGEVTG